MIFTLLVALFVIDDGGRVRSTDEWRGTPTIVAPMYCRCPLACPLIAKGLKRGIAESSTSPADYRVVLFSMDPRDTPEDLRRFGERHQLPLSWTLVSARNPRPFLDASTPSATATRRKRSVRASQCGDCARSQSEAGQIPLRHAILGTGDRRSARHRPRPPRLDRPLRRSHARGTPADRVVVRGLSDDADQQPSARRPHARDQITATVLAARDNPRVARA
jgi:SCO1/SenC